MPLPFILAGVAVAAAGYGAKKGYDGYQDKSRAGEIVGKAKEDYDKSKLSFDSANSKTTESLEKLGKLQLQIGSEFAEFRKIADELLKKLNRSGDRDLKIDIPQHRLDKIDNLSMSTTAYLGKVVGAGAAGAAAAYAVYGGVMAFAAASTGTSISALSGVAAYNATMAAIGGGSLAAGGFGMAGGAMVLGGVVAAPIIAIAGWAFASHAEEALNDAYKTRDEVEEAVSKMNTAKTQLVKTAKYVGRIHGETSRIHEVFLGYFSDLKTMDAYIRNGGDMGMVEDQLVRIIGNGYQLAAILTDIITTPLFKVKVDNSGQAVVDEKKVVEIETDKNGMQILNTDAIDNILVKSSQSADRYKQS